MQVLLIAGGWSSEREVALSGAKGIHQALENLGHHVDMLDPAHELDQLLDRAQASDFAFLSLHGAPGEDGLIQAMLDRVGCPYQGTGPAGSFLALNKVAAKHLFVRNGLTTPRWDFLPSMPQGGYTPSMGLPVFVKANTGGSSLDMGLARTQEELDELLGSILGKSLEVVVEEALSGVELTCGVLGGDTLPPILIRPVTEGSVFFDYASKYVQGGAEELCPAPVNEELTRELKDKALKAHQILGLEGYSRADFILADNTLYLLEVNTLPGMTPTSLLPQSAAAVGMSFEDLIAKLMDLGLARHGGG
ncbi:MAG: D-alanine--D-alanine ligase [Desulfovibrio sp.]|nr:MAG: D-alanine--D-alanine ligase [Desulfovibrio sp.]